MNLDMNKYVFYTHNNKVIAVSTYAGKKVKGVAKCNPEDTYDLEKGKKLAAARCNAKVAIKRRKNARAKLAEAKKLQEIAAIRVTKMEQYYLDSIEAQYQAVELIDETLKTL